MPETMTLQKTGTIDGVSYIERITTEGDSIERASPSIPAAKVGQLTTRTDANTGVLTMVTGHGFATSDKIDVFWTGGSRRAMDATVATNAVTVDGGSGDDLPANLTAITAMKPVEVVFDLDGDTAVGLSVYSPKAGYVVFVDNVPADIAAATYQLDAGEGKSWIDGDGTNPLASATITKVKFSHGDSAAARTMVASVVHN